MRSFLCPGCGRSLALTRCKIKCLCGMVMRLPRPPIELHGELIRFSCQLCGKRLKAEQGSAGRTGKCSRCGSTALVPSAQASVEAAIAASPSRPPAPPGRPPPENSSPLPARLPSLQPDDAAPDRNPMPAALRPPTRQPMIESSPRNFSALAGVASVAVSALALVLLLMPGYRGLGLTLTALAVLVGLVGLVSGLRTGRAVGLAAVGSVAGLLFLAAVGLLAVFTGGSDSAGLVDPMILRTSLPLTLDRKGDIQLAVTAATVGPAPTLGSERSQWAGKPLLMITIRVENLGSRPVTFRGWDNLHQNRPGGRPRLADNLGRSYSALEFRLPGAAPVGQPRPPQPVTARGIADVLFFAPPDPGVDWLSLDVPASAVGQSGVFVLRIQGSAIRRSTAAREQVLWYASGIRPRGCSLFGDDGRFTNQSDSSNTTYVSDYAVRDNDFNGDGRIDIIDFGQFAIRSFTTLP